MAKTAQDVMQLIREQGIKMVDFKMVDINGSPARMSAVIALSSFARNLWQLYNSLSRARFVSLRLIAFK